MRGSPWWTLAGVSIGVVMVGLDASVVAIANPHIAVDLHASLADLQWITDAYMLALASLLIFGGKLGDRFGRRRMFLTGVVGFAATSVGIGLIGTVGGVIALRALQGIFGALLMPNTLAIVRSTFPRDKLNMAIAIWAAASGVSIAAGPIIGGLLVEHVSWQSVFYINAPIAVAALLIGGLAITKTKSENRQRLDLPGIAALSGGLFLIVFGLIKAQNWGWTSNQTLGILLGGLLALAVFVLIELRTTEPLLPMRLFANRSLTIGTTVMITNLFALFGTIFFMTLYLQNVQGFSPMATGVRTLPLSLMLMVTAPVSGIVTKKFGPRPAMVAGLAAVSGGLFSLTSLHTDSGYQALWPAFMLLGAGIGLVLTAGSDAIVGSASVDDAGVAGGLQSTAVQLGGVMGTTILGSILTSRVGSVLVGDLTSAGAPQPLAAKLAGAKEVVAEGVAPTIPGAPSQLSYAIAQGSHTAFIAGLHTTMTVAAAAAGVGAVLALFVQRGEDDA
jgi:EmrB/QacA subfamily drug resistance transporter